MYEEEGLCRCDLKGVIEEKYRLAFLDPSDYIARRGSELNEREEASMKGRFSVGVIKSRGNG